MVNESDIQELLDRAHIIETVNSYGIGVDTRNFKMFRDILADEVEVDYTSMLSGEPYRIKADDLVKNWEGLLTAFESTQHMISNHIIKFDKDNATCTTHFQAHHILMNKKGDCSWIVAGYYVHKLIITPRGWKINFTQLDNLWGEGNYNLVLLAGQAAAKKDIIKVEA